MTLDEYKKERIELFDFVVGQKYRKLDVECPMCGKPMYRDETFVLASYPPKYRLECRDCGYADSSY